MDKSVSLETLYSSLIYLMSRQAMAPQSHLPTAIADHLNWIATHADVERHPAIRDTCRRLAPFWEGTNRHSDPESPYEGYTGSGYGLN